VSARSGKTEETTWRWGRHGGRGRRRRHRGGRIGGERGGEDVVSIGGEEDVEEEDVVVVVSGIVGVGIITEDIAGIWVTVPKVCTVL